MGVKWYSHYGFDFLNFLKFNGNWPFFHVLIGLFISLVPMVANYFFWLLL